MDKCIYDKGYCDAHSDSEVKEPCVEGPCKDEVRLLPCPFCGGEAVVRFRGANKDYMPECSNNFCMASYMLGASFDTREEATEAWNRRV